MNVEQAIALLQLMPPHAVLVATDGPPRAAAPKGELHGLRAAADAPALNGFSAEELRREEHEFFLLDGDVVVLAMVRNCLGQPV